MLTEGAVAGGEHRDNFFYGGSLYEEHWIVSRLFMPSALQGTIKGLWTAWTSELC